MLFFFFQAEDGIRDLTVTGVQTCALPISRCMSGTAWPERERSGQAVPDIHLDHVLASGIALGHAPSVANPTTQWLLALLRYQEGWVLTWRCRECELPSPRDLARCVVGEVQPPSVTGVSWSQRDAVRLPHGPFPIRAFGRHHEQGTIDLETRGALAAAETWRANDC